MSICLSLECLFPVLCSLFVSGGLFDVGLFTTGWTIHVLPPACRSLMSLFTTGWTIHVLPPACRSLMSL
ncbi:hypothetical protein J4Q44_G00392960, partial [Coregonus suidteri]